MCEAEKVDVVTDIESLLVDVGNAGSNFGTGGMVTKLKAARIGNKILFVEML